VRTKEAANANTAICTQTKEANTKEAKTAYGTHCAWAEKTLIARTPTPEAVV
jgi:hypothetical protein